MGEEIMANESASFVELTIPGTVRKYTDEEREHHCEDWKRSGLSMSEYCRRSGLAVSTLSKWLNEVKNKLPENSEEKTSSINNLISPGIEIILVSGIRLRLSRITISEVLRFVKALESCN